MQMKREIEKCNSSGSREDILGIKREKIHSFQNTEMSNEQTRRKKIDYVIVMANVRGHGGECVAVQSRG